MYQAKLANLMEVANGAPNNAGAVVPDIPRHRFGSGDNTQLDHPILGDRQRAEDAGIGEVIAKSNTMAIHSGACSSHCC